MHVACLQHRSSKSMPACNVTAACACEVSRSTNKHTYRRAQPTMLNQKSLARLVPSCICGLSPDRPAVLPLQEALDSSRQERESGDAEWDARHQEAVDSAEQWKAFADKLTKEKEEQQQQLASASSELQVEHMRLLLHVACQRH